MVGCVILLMCGAAALAHDGYDAQAEFNHFVDDYWSWRLEQSPEFATKAGSNLHADKWQSLTEETFVKDKNKADEFLAASMHLKPECLTEQDVITFRVIQTTLKRYISGYKYRKYTQYNPVTPMNFIFSDWKQIIGLMPTKTITDYDNLIFRYRGLDTVMNETTALMREAIRLNTTQHQVSVTGAADKVTTLLAEISNRTSFFHQPLYRFPEQFTDQQGLNITQTMTYAIEMILKPAIRRFGNFIEQEYAPNTRSIPGVYSLPSGQELYQECLRWHLDTTLTAQQVHDMGLSEVQRIQNNIQKIMTDNNFNGTLLEYLTYVKSLPENYYETEDDMLNGYREIINSNHKQLHKILPRMDMECPVIVEQATNPQAWASYKSPSADMSTPGKFVINVFNPETRPNFGMTSLSLHETVPGHHTQACYTISRGVKRKGRKIAFRKYYAAPFNFPFFSSFSEGWALYAESLGEEMGVYDTSNKLLGRYLNEIFRAVRLVVDTGIHSFGWSRQRAINYIAQYSTRSMDDIENEVNRYITWPGQACSYKVGELKIRELREKAEKKLGPIFDKRYFHDEVLSLGSVPLSVLEDHIDRWIDNKLGHASGSSHVAACITIITITIMLTCSTCI